MRNIKIVKKRQHPLPSRGSQSTVYCLGEHGSLHVCSGGTLQQFSMEENQNVAILCENRELLGDAVQMQYVASTGLIYMINGRGSFFQFMLHSSDVEELFQSEQGISYFSVSPDSRYVVIVTGQNVLLLLTLPDLETTSQYELFEGASENNSVTESVKVVWRKDSHYFAVIYKNIDKFHIKIFDENGNFHSKTEDENPLLDSILEWQPSGGLIASVGSTPHGTVVSLFERNGLKRADFYPYEGKSEKYEENHIKELLWNPTSDILALVYSSKVELWCRNNYVWMRKLTLCGNRDANISNLCFVSWDHERKNRLHIVNDLGMYVLYDVTFTYTSGYASGSAIVASWNGNSFYSTPFRISCCPPPYCLFQKPCETDLRTVVVPEFWDGMLTISLNCQLIFWRHEKNELKAIKTLTLDDFHFISESYDWTWPSRNIICCVSDGSLYIFELQNGDFEEMGKDVSISSRTLPVSNNIISAFPAVRNIEDPSILIQTSEGLILKVNLHTGNSIACCKFPHICTEIQTLSEEFIIGHDPLTRKLLIGWSKYLDCEPVVLNNDCTSFTVFQNSVIYTTIQGFLEVRNASYITKFLENKLLGNEFTNEQESAGRYIRKCEKGSVIVRCCLNQMLEPSLVLQILPRGNLEIIYPRPLVIDTVKMIMREKENSSRYEKIMAALRRHRIDYRILIDEMKLLISEEPDCRLDELLKTMIEQVKDSHSLVLLVTDLNQDYSDCILAIKNILEGVIKNNSEKRMLHVEESYLASMAKLGLLEEALKSSLILGEGENNRELVQQRVKFLSFYCENPDILFDTALGTYDLSLASLVADCLGKDPKEYIPVLDGFQSMLELKRRFKIDDKLRRFGKAVINLVRDQRIQHDEIIKYTERHRLFTDVIGFLTRKLKYDEGGVVERSGEDTGALLREAQSSYAEYLEERGKLLEASILYRDASKTKKSIDCGVKSGNWEFALETAYESSRNDDEIKSICKDVVVQLEDKKMYGEAARVCENYIGDMHQAVYFWVKDKKWQHASTLSLKTPTLGKSFRDENVKTKLMEVCNEQKEAMQQIMEDVRLKLLRLRKVKETKAHKLAEMGGLGDNFSDTESYLSGSSTSGSITSSNASGKSYRSSKNKRKLERKVYSLKEGSKYEDLAIMAYLWCIADKIQQEIKPDVSNTIESLWKFGENECAMQICDVMEKMLQATDKCIQEVWSVPITEELLEPKYRIPPTSWSPIMTKLTALHEPSSKAATR